MKIRFQQLLSARPTLPIAAEVLDSGGHAMRRKTKAPRGGAGRTAGGLAFAMEAKG
ncbi:MAG: hypothetical protein HPY45_06890 [Anaerolineae bacterium]|nr:hypothetical protein [Anaerolineae bacterium]